MRSIFSSSNCIKFYINQLDIEEVSIKNLVICGFVENVASNEAEDEKQRCG